MFIVQIINNLKSVGRVIDQVKSDGNCLFESVSRQITDRRMNAARLRAMACNEAEANAANYKVFLEETVQRNYSRLVRKTRETKVWDNPLGDVMPTIIFNALGQKPLIIFRHNNNPQVFPDPHPPITGNTIIIVQDASQTHYDATVPAPVSPVRAYQSSSDEVTGTCC